METLPAPFGATPPESFSGTSSAGQRLGESAGPGSNPRSLSQPVSFHETGHHTAGRMPGPLRSDIKSRLKTQSGRNGGGWARPGSHCHTEHRGPNWAASPPRCSAVPPDSWLRCRAWPGRQEPRVYREVRAPGPVASLRGRGHSRLGGGCALPLAGCRVPLNLSLFHRVGLSPKPDRPAWDEGLRQAQKQGSAQKDSLSVQHGPVLAKPGADSLAVFPPHHSLRVLLSVLQPRKLKPSSSQA